ncbi:unnamed protein product [Pylaiella littoralis]
MQVVITLFLDKRSGRFQRKEYKLRLVQAEKGRAIITGPALATFTLDASLYAHLGAGPSVEQPVDLYAPKLEDGSSGFAVVHLRVLCCESLRNPRAGNSISTSNVPSSTASSRTGLPPQAGLAPTRPGLSPPHLLQSGLLVGSSFGFSMSGSGSRYSPMSMSPGSSAFSTPIFRRHRRPWSNEDLGLADSATSMRSSIRMRSSMLMRSKVGSKSFNDLDDSGQYSTPSKRSGRTLRGNMSFGRTLGSVASTGDSKESMADGSNGVGRPHLALSGRREPAAEIGVLSPISSYSGAFAVATAAGRESGGPQQQWGH